ncbi:hypothetical protein ACFQ0M_09725 [Kitasatospora aburaviensis]
MALRGRVKAGVVVGVVVAGCLAAVALDDGRRVGPPRAYGSFGGSAAAEEWVAYGDHAAVITVTDEVRGRPDPNSEDYVPRTVSATVSEVIWSRPGAVRLPGAVMLPVRGWYDPLLGGEQEDAARAARLEPGHTYLVGLAETSGGLRPIGDEAAVPYDDATFGKGEIEGRVVDPIEYYRALRELPRDSVARFAVNETHNRKTLADVRRLLAATSAQNVHRQAALDGIYTDADLDGRPDEPWTRVPMTSPDGSGAPSGPSIRTRTTSCPSAAPGAARRSGSPSPSTA